MTITNEAGREQLLHDGYCIVPNILPSDLLSELRNITDRMLDDLPESVKADHVSTGSMIPVSSNPFFSRLIALPGALAALADMGYSEPKFSSGYVISKPPHSPRLFWHHDWAAWSSPDAFGQTPQQLFLMYYLTDTNPVNGCLRLIPGTHRGYHPLLDQIGEAHRGDILRAQDLSAPEFSDAEGEVDVPIHAGDLVIGDSRLMHASHANTTGERRTVITLWYHPDMNALEEATQGFIAGMWSIPASWPEADRNLVAPLKPVYAGSTPKAIWDRKRPRGR